MIATLGQEAQVITLALDLLLERGEPIKKVMAILSDPSYPPLGRALSLLRQEFEHFYGNEIVFLPEILSNKDGYLPDLVTEEQIRTAHDSIYHLIHYHKGNGANIHLSIAGGRKTLGVFAFLAAQYLFDDQDHIWHLVSDDNMFQSRRLHAENGDVVSLIEIPFFQWSSLPGTIRARILGEHIEEAKLQQTASQKQQNYQQAQMLLKLLTKAESELLYYLVQSGGTNEEIGQHLHKSPKTIANQLYSISQKFAEVYHIPADRIERSELIAILAPILAHL